MPAIFNLSQVVDVFIYAALRDILKARIFVLTDAF